jgi:hypothetical protein
MSYVINMKQLTIVICLAISLINAEQNLKVPVFIPESLGKIGLQFDGNSFAVEKHGKFKTIQSYDIDPALKNISHDKLHKFVKNGGYLALNRLNNKDYVLKARVRGDGGFLLTGVIVYQTCRVVGHASIWTAAGASIVGGFAIGGPAGAGAAYLNALATIPTATAVVESGSLAIGTAASWIPGLP